MTVLLNIISTLWSFRFVILAALAALHIGIWLGEWNGKSMGEDKAYAAVNTAATKEMTQSMKLRERVENETRTMSDDDVDRDLTRNGWMRPLTDR